MTMLNSSASQGSPALPLIGPTPTIPIPVETESGGVILFDWPTDVASGTVTVRTPQGALVFQAPLPINQAGPLVDDGDYIFTWEGKYTNGQTFSQTGSTTVPEPAPSTPVEPDPLTAEEKAVETAKIDTTQHAALEAAWAQVQTEMASPYNNEITSTITVLGQLRTGFYTGQNAVDMQAAYNAYADWVINVWQGLFVTTFKGFEQWLIVFKADHPNAESLRHLF